MFRLGQAVAGLLICTSGAALALAQPRPVNEAQLASAYFQTLRETYAQAQPGVIAWTSSDERKNVVKLYDEKAPEPFLAAARAWLLKCPVDAKIQGMTATLLTKGGRIEEGIRHMNAYYGLLASIVNSGDGKSPATAFKVISIDEEYTILALMGARLRKQSLQGECDVMEVVVNGMTATIYFDVSIHLKGLQREIESAKVP